MTVEWIEEELGPPAGQRPRRSRLPLPRPRWSFALGTLAVGLVVGAVVGRVTASGTGSVARLPVSGLVVTADFTLYVNSPPINATSGPAERCVGAGAASGVNAGTPLVVMDVDSHVLGATFLGNGQLTRNGRGCRFPFQLTVPEAAGNWYRLQVGNRPEAAVHGTELDGLRIRVDAP